MRPTPKILLETTDEKTFKTEQVLESSAVYCVFYKGRPISIRQVTKENEKNIERQKKYKMVNFSNPKHAVNLAAKLNKQYGINDFSVFFITNGVPYIHD